MIKIDDAELMESVGVLKNVANTGIIEAMNNLASVLKDDAGNPQVDNAIEGCKKMQSQFNVFTDSMTKYLDVFGQLTETSDKIKKMTLTEVADKDTSFKVRDIDVSSVRV